MEPVYERYTPQHPLPEEIQNLSRNDTVCHYCGVSYLIHREIKILEEKIEKMQEELDKCYGWEERESELLRRVKELQDYSAKIENENKEMNKKSSSLNKHLELRTKELRESQNNLKNVEKDISDLNGEIISLTKEYEDQRNKNKNLQKRIVSIFNSLKQEKQEISQISSDVKENKVQIKSMFADFWKNIKQLNTAHQIDIETLKTSLMEMEQKSRDEIETQNKKQKEIFAREKELLQELNLLETETKGLRIKLKSNEEKMEDLKIKLTKSEESCKFRFSECIEYKEQIKNMKQIVEDLNVQLKKKDQNMENLLQKSQMESHDLQQKLQSIRREYKKSQDQLLEKQTIENEIQRKQDLSLALIEQMKKTEQKLMTELEFVKQEREESIISHHQQMEKLKESFRQKTTDSDQWQLKLETALQQEQNKHNKEIQELKGNLTENFLMDLEIEKQKYQQLVDKYHEDSQAAEDKLKEKVESAVKCHLDAIKDLENLLSTTTSSCNEREESLKREINGLKKVIKDLESNIVQMGNTGQDEIIELRSKFGEAQQEIHNLERQLKTAHQQLEEAKTQVVSLQEIVQQECEERMELTESLTCARLELLQLKKPAGGYNKVISKSQSSQQLPLSSASRLTSLSQQGNRNDNATATITTNTTATTTKNPPLTSFSDSFLINSKSVDQPKSSPLLANESALQSLVPLSKEFSNNNNNHNVNKETKPVKDFLAENKKSNKKSGIFQRKISDDRRRFLALLSRNSIKASKTS